MISSEAIALTRRFAIFRCDKDDCWIVCVWEPNRDLYLGVAECPDEETARRVLDGLIQRHVNRRFP